MVSGVHHDWLGMALNILLRMFNKLIIDGLRSNGVLIDNTMLIHERGSHRFNGRDLMLADFMVL